MTSGVAGSSHWDLPLKPPRAENEGLREQLRGWLAKCWPDAPNLRLSQLEWPKSSGVSNETVLFEARWDGGSRGLVARLQTDDPLYLDSSVERQYLMYEALAGAPGVVVPGVVALELDPGVIGTPFFVMNRIEGLVPGGNPHFTKAGWVLDATPAERARLWRSAVEQLVALHRLDVARFAFLDRPERGTNGLEQDLTYWRKSYRWAAEGEVHPVMEAGEAWLLAHLPANPATGLSWGDARIENMMFREFVCVSVFDFESASLAGPAADLAWWALMDKASMVMPGLGSPNETIALYRELGGGGLEDLHYALVLCAFRLAAIYLKLAKQLETRGRLVAKDMGPNSEKMQQLAMLIGVAPPGPVTATLPELDL